jgi:hypothetical protein
MNQNIRPKFPLGQFLITPGAFEALNEAGQSPLDFVVRHALGDWGVIGIDDKALNDAALLDGSRLLSAYRTSKGEKIWVITEAADENGNRVCTTVLKPDEY